MAPQATFLAIWLLAAASGEETRDAQRGREAERALAEDLESTAPRTRRAAVKKLAALGTRAGWELVVGALADPEGEVADEAQLAFTGCAELKVAEELFGQRGLASREPAVRERAAEALGRLAVPVDAGSLRRALAQAEDECARLVCWSIERLAPAGRVAGPREELAQALARFADARGGAAEARGAAVLALARLDTRASEERVRTFTTAREPALRCAAAYAARAWTEMDAVAIARALAADEDAGVRAGAVELLAGIPGRDSALLLVERLEREERPRISWRILAHLRGLSGQDHGFDAEAWRTWARERAGAVSTGEASAGGPLGETGVALAGLPLTSDRAAFLIDLSGSMWGTKVAGKTRKEIVDLELRRALEALPREARFNVVPYATRPFPWEERLVRAQPNEVRRAIEDFERCHHSGRGNVWDAATAALADPDVDALVILTDGVPTGGMHSALELVVELFLEKNRFRNVAFDTVLVDAPRGALAGWRRLAQASGGRSIAVDLAALARGSEAIPPVPPKPPPPRQRTQRARSSASG